MRVLYKATLCFAIAFFMSVNSLFAMHIVFGCRYIPIDSLSMNDISREVNLDLKTKRIDLSINNEVITFIQTYEIDTSSFEQQFLESGFEGGKIILHITELLSVDNDSIFVSATYQRFNEKHDIGRLYKIEKLAISKSELLGVAVSPTMQEMKKMTRRYFLFLGTVASIIATLSIIGEFHH